MDATRRAQLLELAHAVAPELTKHPLYILGARELGITPRMDLSDSDIACAGLAGNDLDLACRDAIGPSWQGRGTCILIAQPEADNAEAVVLHELAHFFSGNLPPSIVMEGFEPRTVGMYVLESVDATFTKAYAESELPRLPDQFHRAAFHRALIHLQYRARQTGFIAGTAELGIKARCPLYLLTRALGGEPERCIHFTFADFMARPMPRRFRKLWNRRHVLAGRKDSPMSLVDLIRGLKSRKEAAIDHYAGAVARVAEDGKVPLEMLERLLESAGKSPEDFAADVERLKRRTEAAQLLRAIPDCNSRRKQCAQRLADARAIFDRAEAVFDAANNEATVEFDAIRDHEQKIRECRRFLEDTADERTRERVRETERALQEALNARATAQAVVERATSVLRIIEQRLQDAQAGRVLQVGERRHIGPEFTVEECQRQVETARAALAAAEKRHDEARQAAEQAEQKTDETRRLLLIP
jgi:hypothetical protein